MSSSIARTAPARISAAARLATVWSLPAAQLRVRKPVIDDQREVLTGVGHRAWGGRPVRPVDDIHPSILVADNRRQPVLHRRAGVTVNRVATEGVTQFETAVERREQAVARSQG